MSLRRIHGANLDPIDVAADPFLRRKMGIYNPGMPWEFHVFIPKAIEHKMKIEPWEREHHCSVNLQPDGSLRYVSFRDHKIVHFTRWL